MKLEIAFFSGERVWSRVIRLRSQSVWSHVGIVIEHAGDRWVIEALEGKGVRLVPFRCWWVWKGQVAVATVKGLSEESVRNATSFAMQVVGCEYASPWQFLRSFGFLTRWLCRVFRVRHDLEGDRFFCSELVAHALLKAGIALPAVPAEMSPGDIASLPGLEF